MRISTFNVQGCTKQEKQIQLIADMHHYAVDICMLQETKASDKTIIVENSKFKIILKAVKTPSYGMGMILSNHWASKLSHFEYAPQSERIAIAIFSHTNNTNNNKKFNKSINVYAPTQQRFKTNTRERELMYDQLEQIIQDTNRFNTELFVIGDLNSVVGLRRTG